MKTKSRRRILILLMSIIITTFTACNTVTSKEEPVAKQGVDTAQEEPVANQDVNTVQEETVAEQGVNAEQEETVYEDDICFALEEPDQQAVWIEWSYTTKEEAEKEPIVGEPGEFPRTVDVYLIVSNNKELKEIKAWWNDADGHEPDYEYYCKGAWVVCPVLEKECQITFGLICKDGTEGYMTFKFT